jgi:hypothetical protein
MHMMNKIIHSLNCFSGSPARKNTTWGGEAFNISSKAGLNDAI